MQEEVPNEKTRGTKKECSHEVFPVFYIQEIFHAHITGNEIQSFCINLPS